MDTEDYAISLAAMNDETLEAATGSAILGSAVMNRFPRWGDDAHKRCDLAYAECAKRNRGIYQRAYNNVARSQGHDSMVQKVNPNNP